MAGFKQQTQQTAENVNVKLSGRIDETSQFNDIMMSQQGMLVLDFEEVTYLNSAGIRKFVVWLAKLEKENPKSEFVFERVPPVIMQKAELIKQFMPRALSCDSTYVSFACADCGECEDHLVVLDRKDRSAESAYRQISQFVAKARKCGHCGGNMDVDMNPANYLKILLDNGRRSA